MLVMQFAPVLLICFLLWAIFRKVLNLPKLFNPATVRWGIISFILYYIFLCIIISVFSVVYYSVFGKNIGYYGWGYFISKIFSINLTTFALYGLDKRNSTKDGAPRVPEIILHILAFLLGAVGAKLAQRYFSHKTTKPPFPLVTNIALACNLVVIFLMILSNSNANI